MTRFSPAKTYKHWEWHSWFAWFPVRIVQDRYKDGLYVWWERIERIEHCSWGGCYAEYRLPVVGRERGSIDPNHPSVVR